MQAAARILESHRISEAPAGPALRRPAPARRHGPRHRARSQGVPVRRAAVEPRRQAAGVDAQRDQGHASAAEDHDDLRHPRPGRGDDHGRPHRRAARRPHRADRHAAGTLRQPGQRVRRRVHRLARHEHAAGAVCATDGVRRAAVSTAAVEIELPAQLAGSGRPGDPRRHPSGASRRSRPNRTRPDRQGRAGRAAGRASADHRRRRPAGRLPRCSTNACCRRSVPTSRWRRRRCVARLRCGNGIGCSAAASRAPGRKHQLPVRIYQPAFSPPVR